MDDITTLCIEAINTRNSTPHILKPPPIDEFVKLLTLHRKLFKAQDAVYANLRLINPTTEEKKETRERISIMKVLWLEMELSITPKAHLIFDHAADDQELFNGLGDKIEDPLEKRHQIQVKLNVILNKMKGGFVRQMQTQLKYEWRNNNPLVQTQIERVRELTTRKRSHNDITIGRERFLNVKQERHQQRSANMLSIDRD